MQATGTESGSVRPALTAALTALVLVSVWWLAACSVEAENGAGNGQAEESEVLARVGGQPITRAEVEEAAAENLDQVRLELLQCQSESERKTHDVLEDTTRNMVRDRLLDREATERGTTKDQLLAAEVEGKIEPVTEEEVQAFFDENQDRLANQELDQIAPQIESYLRQQRGSEAYQRFISALEAKYEVTYDIEPFRAELDIAGEPSKGPAAAPVTIVEFSDFECPFCSRVLPTLDQVVESYGDRVRIVFKQFPLHRLHPHAQKAAEASLCAHEQGKFWELHDAMFADQAALDVDGLRAKAEATDLDVDAFSECLDAGRYADAVEEDLRQGTIAGVSGTPALFVNGRILSGAVPYETLAETIDDELGTGADS